MATLRNSARKSNPAAPIPEDRWTAGEPVPLSDILDPTILSIASKHEATPPPAPAVCTVPSNVIRAAIARQLGKGDGSIEPGSRPVHGTATVRLHCTVTKDEPTSRAAAVTVDPARLLWGAMIHAGVKGEDMAAVAEQAILFALAADIDDKDAFRLQLLGSLIDMHKKAAARLLPSVPRQGDTHITGFVELVSFEESKDLPQHMAEQSHCNAAHVARNEPERFAELTSDWDDSAA